MLTEEEKARLEYQKSNARSLCTYYASRIRELKSRLDSIRALHDTSKMNYEKADIKLAEHEKLTVVTGTGKPKPIKEFTLDQVKNIAGLLGVDLEGV